MDYWELVEVYDALEGTTKKLKKADILAKFFSGLREFDEVLLLIQGRVFPKWDERKIGMSSKLVMRAIGLAAGASKNEVEKLFKKTGDLGKAAFELIGRKKQMTLASGKLSVEKVFENIRKLAELEGEGTVDRKIQLAAELLTNAKPSEAKYIVKTIIEEMRVGVASGIIRDAIAKAFNADAKDVEKAYNFLVDYAEVARLAKQGQLKKISIHVGNPVKVMLAILVKDVNEGFEAVGKPAIFEYKYDGFRLEVHRKGNEIRLFTRRMEDVTRQFPDIVEVARQNVKGENYIIDCEAVGYDAKTGKYLAFQKISQRIKRIHDIDEMAKKFPIELNVFDVLYYNGKNLMDTELEKRRELLKKIINQQKRKIGLTKCLITGDEEKAVKFFNEAIKAGLEGVMIKNLKSIYRPGRYVKGWVKLKEMLEPLDLVIVGAEYGHGKRAGVLSSFILACRHDNEFLECGKMGTGIKEKESEGTEEVTFKELTNMLKPLIISEKAGEVRIKPRIVVEVGYEEIQKSPKYSSGFALRFPRLLRLRTEEKKSSDANTLKDLERIYRVQKGKKV